MTPTLANFLFEAVNVLLLVAALGWLFFRPVRAMLDAERDRWAKAEGEVTRRRSEAEALAKAAREAHEHAEDELERRRAEIVGAAGEEATRIREETRRALDSERRAIARERDASRQAQAAALAESVGRIAGASVQRLLEALDGLSLDRALLRGACEEARTLSETSRRTATVESARPLDAEGRRLLETALGTGFVERTSSELGAGVRILTPDGQVDASARAIARQAAHDLAAVVAAAPDDAGTDG